MDLLAVGPETGAVYEPRAAPGVRRLLLPRSRYFVYYAIDRHAEVIGVLAIWSCSRGRPPSLRFFRGFEASGASG